MKSIVFIRTGTPRVGFAEFGHVGWGFEIQRNMYNIGAVENDKGGPVNIPASQKDQWSLNTQNPYRPFGIGPKNPTTGAIYQGYDMYKIIDVPYPNPRNAIQMVHTIAQEPYNVIGNNCMDAVYRIILAYGGALPKPSDEIYPVKWFESINAPKQALQDAAASIDFSVYEHPIFEGDSVRFTSNNKEQGYASIAYFGREIEDCVSSINVRSGIIRVFEHPNYKGKFVDFKGPCIIQDLSFYGMDNKISSIYAWSDH